MDSCFRTIFNVVKYFMENLDRRLAFSIKEIIEENCIPYTQAAKIAKISLLDLEEILLGQPEFDTEILANVFKALDQHYPIV